MQEYLQGSSEEAYSVKYMKAKLLEHFGDKIVITTIKNVANVVTFHRTATSIINEFYCQPKQEDDDTEKLRIVETAAKLIKNEIHKLEAKGQDYPSLDEISSIDEAMKFIPDLLQKFLSSLIRGKDVQLKIASLGQALTQAARPKALLAPLQLGLAVQMHHHFASKFLIDSLNSHGFCSSYTTVQNYERCAATTRGTDIPGWIPGTFMQYAADNVDHNTRTLDGTGTFHGMGIVAAITPCTTSSRRIPMKSVTKEEICAAGSIHICHYKGPKECKSLSYNELRSLDVQDPTSNLDLLFKLTIPLLWSPRPAWSGAMQLVCKGAHPGQSSVLFLPMIDMDPSDMTCIYSTLWFITQHAKRYNVTPIVTFDQPLWWKALTIVLNEPVGSDLRSIVGCLGGLHIEMSFLGCIGHLMVVLELVYASNAVNHMLTGKAISRAVRGHLLVDAALNALLVSDALNIPIPMINTKECISTEGSEGYAEVEERGNEAVESRDAEQDVETVRELYKQLIDGKTTTTQVCSADALQNVSNKLQNKRSSMKDQRTAMLWMQYMEMVDILRMFIKAERTGNWDLHLQSVYDMLPFFAAAGHNLYAKSAYIYLQMMATLKEKHPEVYKGFQNGLHVVRRSDRYWAGLSTDLTIEQVLMRSVKTSGGLTRGRGMTEVQRLIWVMSMPMCAEINNAMQSLTDVKYYTSEQHKDTTTARQERDFKDTMEIVAYLCSRNPFSASLRSISTGVIAEERVNADKAKNAGESILALMKCKHVHEYTFRKKQQVVTLATKAAVSIKGTTIQLDPQLLFQRFVLVATGGRYENPKELFKFEMCSYPTALFDASLLPRQANKPALADAIWEELKCTELPELPEQANFVLDGGALLHRVPWPRGLTYDAVCDLYIQYVGCRYANATIVFDGYEDGPSIKDCTHLRRTGIYGQTVSFEPDMEVKTKKEEFLANATNKQRFINLLSAKLKSAGYTTVHASGDADLCIVLTAVNMAQSFPTILVGDDTDLLVLLCYHADNNTHNIFFKPEPKSRSQKRRVWDIKKTKAILGPGVCNNILFLHAVLGCDTTSRLHGIGKGLALKKFNKDQNFREQAEVFGCQSATREDVITAGENALLSLYNSRNEETLDSLRYTRFCQKVSIGSSCLQPESLPPTSAAAAYHSLRVYYQVHQWKGNDSLVPSDWGWQLVDEKLQPIKTDRPAAHNALLEIIRCNCKSDCNTYRCTCKKYNLDCSAACGTCQGQSCANSTKPDFDTGLT